MRLYVDNNNKMPDTFDLHVGTIVDAIDLLKIYSIDYVSFNVNLFNDNITLSNVMRLINNVHINSDVICTTHI